MASPFDFQGPFPVSSAPMSQRDWCHVIALTESAQLPKPERPDMDALLEEIDDMLVASAIERDSFPTLHERAAANIAIWDHDNGIPSEFTREEQLALEDTSLPL